MVLGIFLFDPLGFRNLVFSRAKTRVDVYNSF